MFYVIVCIFFLFLSHCVFFSVIWALLPEINVMMMMMLLLSTDAVNIILCMNRRNITLFIFVVLFDFPLPEFGIHYLLASAYLSHFLLSDVL